MQTELEKLVSLYRKLEIDKQIDHDKFYLYSLITHSTAIEGSTITELENQIMFDQGISIKGKSITEQNMNLDLRNAYETAVKLAHAHTDITVDLLKKLSALVMKNTGQEYNTALGSFSSAQGDLRLLNVTAGVGGKSYMNYSKVPSKLAEFCIRINSERKKHAVKSVAQLYELSFDAHYHLVTIHPWADGNGRMARLIMNMLQFEFNLIPVKILTEDKEEYIKALVETRENDDLNIFRKFMTSVMIKNLSFDIDNYLKSIDTDNINTDNADTDNVDTDNADTNNTDAENKKGDRNSREKISKSREKRPKSREKIIELLSHDRTLSTAMLAELIGVTPKAIEKQTAKLKADGVLKRIGPDKGGYWQVVKRND